MKQWNSFWFPLISSFLLCTQCKTPKDIMKRAKYLVTLQLL
jgi:hypothetical protein